MNKKTVVIIVLLSFVLGGLLSFYLISAGKQPQLTEAKPQPLYWVAPMDANYRRDAPGKSPMGMDLIPFYQQAGDSGEQGLVRISPTVEHNLGVTTATVRKAELDRVINTVGYVQYDQDKLLHIHPRVEGWVEKLFVKTEGERVQQGSALYTLYSPQLVSAQEEYLLALNSKNSRLIASSESRLQALHLTAGFIQSLKQSKKAAQTITFYAPQTGVVAKLAIREGFYVKPGSTLMSVAALSSVWVEAEVFAQQAPWLQQGLAVAMQVDYAPVKTWRGEVDYIYPALDKTTRALRVRLRFDNPQELLKPNMYAHISIQGKNTGPVLTVPKQALIRTGKQDRVVLALGAGQFKSIAVQAGRSSGAQVEIVAGLSEGDRVVTSAQFLLDSESSKTADFARMDNAVLDAGMKMDTEMEMQP